MKKLNKIYFLKKVVKLIRTFKKNPKEITFIDRPIGVKTYVPKNRTNFNDTFKAVFEQLKSE